MIASAATPTGRLTRKIQRQLSALVSRPPSTGPRATLTPVIAPQMSKAVPRLGPWKLCARRAREVENTGLEVMIRPYSQILASQVLVTKTLWFAVMAAGHAREHDDAQRLSHLLWEVGAYTGALGEAALAGTMLTPATAGVLDVIAANPGTSIAEMARRLPTSAQGVSQLVSRLERSGYLERRLGERGHGVALFVTESGEAARREADRCKSELENELVAALGQRTYEQLVGSLIRARPRIAELSFTRRARG